VGAGIGAAIGGGFGYSAGWVADRLFTEEVSSKPPPGSKPIDQTKWSGDHAAIKGQIGLGPRDKTSIDPNGNVWGQNPDGSWENYGPATDYTGSGKAQGRRGKDRERGGNE
jgi:hypothetical protein